MDPVLTSWAHIPPRQHPASRQPDNTEGVFLKSCTLQKSIFLISTSLSRKETTHKWGTYCCLAPVRVYTPHFFDSPLQVNCIWTFPESLFNSWMYWVLDIRFMACCYMEKKSHTTLLYLVNEKNGWSWTCSDALGSKSSVNIRFTTSQSQWKRHKHRKNTTYPPACFHADFSNSTLNNLVSSLNCQASLLLIAETKTMESWAKPEHLKTNLWEREEGGNSILSPVSGEYADNDIPVYYRQISHIHNTF